MLKDFTNGIRIIVTPEYIPRRSDPTKPVYLFAYHISITNESKENIQLLSRYWHITDSKGNVKEIRGPGVIGKKPHLRSGESFEYTSYCHLSSEFGMMRGTFQMIREDGFTFDANINPFKLAIPFSVN